MTCFLAYGIIAVAMQLHDIMGFLDVLSEAQTKFSEARAKARQDGPGILLAARRQFGWTQEELAKRIGIDKTYLSKLERGRTATTLSVLLKLRQVLIEEGGEK